MEEFLQVPKKWLNWSGHLYHKKTVTKSYYVWHIFWYFYMSSLIVPMGSYAWFYRYNLALASDSLSICFVNFLGQTKMLTFFRRRSEFLEITDILENLMKKGNTTSQNRFKKINATAHFLSAMYQYAVIGTASYFLVTPFVKKFLSIILNQPYERELPLKMVFPFEVLESPAYEITVIYSWTASAYVMAHVAAIDGIFIVFSLHIRGHFNNLKHLIMEDPFTDTNENNHLKISFYIKYHNKIIDLSNTICDLFKPVIFFQFMLTSLQVCVVMYQLMEKHGDKSIPRIIQFATLLLSTMAQLLVFSYGGEAIKNESEMVAQGVILSKWYKLSPSNQRSMGLILNRAQKPTLVVAGFYTATLANYVTILKAAMSYVTMMQSLDE